MQGKTGKRRAVAGTKDAVPALLSAAALLAALLWPAPASARAEEPPQAAFSAKEIAHRLAERGEPNPPVYLDEHHRLAAHPELAAHPRLWHLHNFGQDGGRPGADIGWLDAMAHDERDFRYDRRVAVLDTGVQLDHPELAGRICRLEEPGNGIDDDGNGFVDDAWGWDFIDQDADPTDKQGHGTAVASLIAARDDATGGLGVIGAAREACIVPVRIIGAETGTVAHVIAGIRYAARLGVKVVNISASNKKNVPQLAREVRRARARGVLVVASAGNDKVNTDKRGRYPASYRMGNVVGVGATDRRDHLASFSNYGPKTVDLLAPGAALRAAELGGGAASFSGTSGSAPLVSAAASELLRSAPQLGPAALKRLLMRGAQTTTSSMPLYSVSGGRLSLDRSLAILPADRSTSAPKGLKARRLGKARGPRRARRQHRFVLFSWKAGEPGQRYLLVVDGEVRKELGPGRRKVRLRLAKRPARNRHTAYVIGADAAGNEARSAQIRFR